MNVTAKHGQAAVHLSGHELGNGRWAPACGTQHHNVGGREVTPLRPTDRDVTCKRCLKLAATVKTPEAKREGARQGWEKFHAAMDVMNKRTDATTVLVMNVETAPEVKEFHRKIQKSIGFKF